MMSPVRASPRLLDDVRAGAWATVAMLLAGAPAGLLWARLTPDIRTVFDELGRPGLREYESGQFFTVEVSFLLAMVGVGILCGLVGTKALHRHGPALAAGLAAGGTAAGFLAREVGERAVVDGRVARFCTANPADGFCTIFDGRLDLRSPQLVLALAFAALVTHIAVTFFRDRARADLVEAPGSGALREVGQL